MPDQKLLDLEFNENLHFTVHAAGLEEPLALGQITLWSQGEDLLSGEAEEVERRIDRCEQQSFGIGD